MAKEKLPKVTIVLPVYNGFKYVKEAVDSALSQTYKNLEIIVVNDGSNDEGKTDEILKSYGNKIKYFKQENKGVSAALNFAINKSTGDYISWISHDDVYYPDKIEKQIKYLIENDYLDKKIILYGDYDLIDSKSRLITECTKDHKMLTEKPEYALLRGSINGITLLIPKKAFDDCGLFDENLRCTQDYELWLRMSKKYLFVHMPGIIAKSRQHKEQVSIRNPKVITEGNVLWIDMITSLSKKDMERLEGSEYSYYKEMAKFLVDSPYKDVQKFCEEKCNELEVKILKKIENIRVSIIMPFYNRADLVKKSIESVINQTHKNIEVIAIDDGSTDDMSEIKNIIKKYDNMKLIELKENKGPANARNIGFDNATGEYIALLDSDDLFKENKIERQLQLMLLNNALVSHTSYLRKGFNSEVVMHSGELTGRVIPKIIYSCLIATPTVMIKRELLESKKYRFNTNLRIGEDTCFWLELFRNNNLLGIDEDLTIVNVLESSSAYSPEKQILGTKTVLKYVLNDEEYSKYDYEIALLCNYYINEVNKISNKTIDVVNITCPNCEAIMNSKSWKVTKPLRLITRGIGAIRKYGLLVTLKKGLDHIRKK